MKNFESPADQSIPNEVPDLKWDTGRLEAEKYFKYVVNVLPERTPADLKDTKDYKEVLQKSKKILEELDFYKKLRA